jgi:hypothetical protein
MSSKTGDENGGAERFIGAWALSSCEYRLRTGEVLKPFGDHPAGRIIYTANGQMSAQLMDPASAIFASADTLQATSEEVDGAWHKYVGYWGTYTVDREASAVTHHVEGAWFPNWTGTDQVRSFLFEGDRLTLSADTAELVATLVWRRAE